MGRLISVGAPEATGHGAKRTTSDKSAEKVLALAAAARVDWVARQLEYVWLVRIVAGQARDPDKLKVRIMLHNP